MFRKEEKDGKTSKIKGLKLRGGGRGRGRIKFAKRSAEGGDYLLARAHFYKFVNFCEAIRIQEIEDLQA